MKIICDYCKKTINQTEMQALNGITFYTDNIVKIIKFNKNNTQYYHLKCYNGKIKIKQVK